MEPFLAYLTTLCDPLTGVVRRISAERAAVAELVADPVRAGVWFAAAIGPFMRALPPGDPWRSLTVMLPDGRQMPDPTVLDGVEPLDAPGAVDPSTRPFGSVQNLLDLVPRGAENIA